MLNRIFESARKEDLRVVLVLARISLFIIFFWFGSLKVIYLSPANGLVEQLLDKTLPFIAFRNFIVFFGLFEMLIGLALLVPKFDRISVPLFFFHMFTTALPLILLPYVAWQRFFVPTLEGQYIIKNLALVSLVLIFIASYPNSRNIQKR